MVVLRTIRILCRPSVAAGSDGNIQVTQFGFHIFQPEVRPLALAKCFAVDVGIEKYCAGYFPPKPKKYKTGEFFIHVVAALRM